MKCLVTSARSGTGSVKASNIVPDDGRYVDVPTAATYYLLRHRRQLHRAIVSWVI
jgi:hypothetical protein